jgi:hypothetical protein
MKNLIYIFLLVFTLTGCSNKVVSSMLINRDTVYVEKVDTKHIADSVEVNRLKFKIKSLEFKNDSLQNLVKHYRDSIDEKNYMNERRIEKINYYIRITQKNSKNKKFFYGWIKELCLISNTLILPIIILL